MRIGIDMLAVQSPGSRLRGVGRYGLNLVNAMLARDDPHDYVLYSHREMPTEHLPQSHRAKRRELSIDASRGEVFLRDVMNRVACENPDDLDALLILNPFELCPGYDPPTRPLGPLRIASIVYDFIPFLDQEHYLSDPGNANWFYRRLHSISRYDRLLAISEATRNDAARLLGLDGGRVVNISGASDGAYFVPAESPLPCRKTRAALHELSIRRPFVLSVAGGDERKNVRGLIEAFSILPRSLRSSHLLVIACHLKLEDAARFRRLGDDLGLGDSLILTGEVSDETLRILYQRCAAFAFPSLYEGLGLPILEAMHCGAAVLAGNNSSQVEVVGDAGVLVNASEPREIAAGMVTLLTDRDRVDQLRPKAIERARQFTWDRTATLTIDALITDSPRTARRPHRPRVVRPRLAVVSPWRPKKSGISTYAAWLVGELSRHYRIDLYHDEGYVPDLGIARDGFSTFDYRLFARNAASRDYRAVLYQMGNSPYHGFMAAMMEEFPGIVTLHDFSLAGFQYWNAHRADDPVAAFRREVLRSEPERADEILGGLESLRRESGGVQDALTRRGIHLNRAVLNAASRIIVHSAWCRDQMRPEHEAKTDVIPHGAWPKRISPARRREMRERFGLPQNETILGSFGFLSDGKMNVESLRAFASIAAHHSPTTFLFVGQDYENGQARREAERLGLGSRVRFLGNQSDENFEALIETIDVGISLRRPPTYGETSGALLNMLRHGVACLVNDVGTFSDYPDHVVLKARWDRDGLDGIVAAMGRLVSDVAMREAMGRAAFEHIEQHHAWPVVAARYIEAIEAQSGRSRGVLPPPPAQSRLVRQAAGPEVSR